MADKNITRRQFMKGLGAAVAAVAGLAGSENTNANTGKTDTKNENTLKVTWCSSAKIDCPYRFVYAHNGQARYVLLPNEAVKITQSGGKTRRPTFGGPYEKLRPGKYDFVEGVRAK